MPPVDPSVSADAVAKAQAQLRAQAAAARAAEARARQAEQQRQAAGSPGGLPAPAKLTGDQGNVTGDAVAKDLQITGTVPIAAAPAEAPVVPDASMEELEEAAGEVRSLADIDAIVEAAEAAGLPADGLLRQMVWALGRDHGYEEAKTELYARIGDHVTRLGDPALGAAITSLGDPAMSAEVRDQLNDALEDDESTAKDFRMAAEVARTKAEVEQILAVVRAKGGDEAAVLATLVEELHAEHSAPEMYAAIADGFAAIGRPEEASLARRLADPDLPEDERDHRLESLQTTVAAGAVPPNGHVLALIEQAEVGDALGHLGAATLHVYTAADVNAIMQAATGLSAEDQLAILDGIVRNSLNRPAEVNRHFAEWNAVGAHYERLGDTRRADAARQMGDPAVDDEGMRFALNEVLVGREDDVDNVARALEAHEADAVRAAQAAYDEALEDVAEDNVTLQMGMAQMQGMPAADVDAFVAEFKRQHPSYAALDAAATEMARVVGAHRNEIADALINDRAYGELSPRDLERALEIAGESPAGEGLVAAITTTMLRSAGSMAEDRLAFVADTLLPKILPTYIADLLAANGNDAADAIKGFEASPLYEILSQIDGLAGAKKDIKSFMTGFDALTKAIGSDSSTSAAGIIDRAMNGKASSALDAGLASVGLVLGAVGLSDATGFADATTGIIGVAKDANSVLMSAGKAFDRLGKALPLEAMKKAGPVLSAIAGTISGFSDLFKGHFADAGVGLAATALGVLSVTAGMPGLNVVATIGVFAYEAFKAGAEEDRRIDDLRGVYAAMELDPGLADFLIESRPGTYQDLRAERGLTDAEILAYTDPDSPWRPHLEEMAGFHNLDQLMPVPTPPGEFERFLDDLGAGLDAEGIQTALAFLAAAVGTSQSTDGVPETPEQKLARVRTDLFSRSHLSEEDFARAYGNVRQLFGLPPDPFAS